MITFTSSSDVEERPNPTPTVISEITTVPFRGPDKPFKKTRDVSVILSDIISARTLPFNFMLPERITDILEYRFYFKRLKKHALRICC